jgi:hypothetical protein
MKIKIYSYLKNMRSRQITSKPCKIAALLKRELKGEFTLLEMSKGSLKS